MEDKSFFDEKQKFGIEITSQSSFYEMCQKKKIKLDCRIPITIVFDKALPKLWLFNSKKSKTFEIYKKNQDKLLSSEIVRQLIQLPLPKVDGLNQIQELLKNYSIKDQPVAIAQMKRNEVLVLNRIDLLQLFLDGKELQSMSYLQEYIQTPSNEVYYVEFRQDQDFQATQYRFYKKTVTKKMEMKKLKQKESNPFNPLIKHSLSLPQVKKQETEKLSKQIYRFLDNTLNSKFQEETKKIVLYFEKAYKVKIRRIIAKFIVDDHQIIYMAGIKKLFIDLPNKSIYQNGMKEELISNGRFENFVNCCKQFKKSKDHQLQIPQLIVEEDKKISNTLYKHLIVEKCGGDFCNYRLMEKNKGPLQLRKGLLESYKNVFKEIKQTIPNKSTSLPFEISYQLIIRTRDYQEDVIQLFQKYKIHLDTINPDENNDIPLKTQYPFMGFNTDVQALINLYKSIKICKNCFVIYSMIQQHFEQELNKDIRNRAQFIVSKFSDLKNIKSAISYQITPKNLMEQSMKTEFKELKSEYKELKSELKSDFRSDMKFTSDIKSQLKSSQSSRVKINRAQYQKKNFLISSIPETRQTQTASPQKRQPQAQSQIEINRLSLGYLNYQKLDQFKSQNPSESQRDAPNQKWLNQINSNLIQLLAQVKSQNLRRLDQQQQENKELIQRQEDLKQILHKSSKKEADCRILLKQYCEEKLKDDVQLQLLSTQSFYYYHVNIDAIRKIYQFQMCTPLKAVLDELKYDSLRELTIEEVCQFMGYDEPTIQIKDLQYLTIDQYTAIPYVLLESPQSIKRQKQRQKEQKQLQSGVEIIILIHDMFESFYEYYEIVQQCLNEQENKKVILFNTPGQAYTLFKKDHQYTNIYIAQILDQILFQLTEQYHINLLSDTLKFIGIGSGGFHTQAFVTQAQTLPYIQNITLINSFSSIYQQLHQFFDQSLKIFTTQPPSSLDLAFEYTNTIMNTKHLTEGNLAHLLNLNPISLQGRVCIINGLLQSPSFSDRFTKLIITVQVYHSLKNCLINISESEYLQTFQQDEGLDVNNVAISKKISSTRRTINYIEGGHQILYENRESLIQIISQI